MKVTVAVPLAAALVIAIAGCGGKAGDQAPATEDATDEVRLTALASDGRRLYEFYCAVCHGANGEGDGFNAWNLDPRPEPFDGNPLVEGVEDQDVASVIRSGGRSVGKSVLMPPWGRTLTDPQIDALVAYVRVLVSEQPPPAEEDASEEDSRQKDSGQEATGQEDADTAQ